MFYLWFILTIIAIIIFFARKNGEQWKECKRTGEEAGNKVLKKMIERKEKYKIKEEKIRDEVRKELGQ